MILSVPENQADAILGAMRAVALEHSPDGMTDGDRWTIAGAATIVLGLAESDPEIVEPRDPEELAATILAEDDARLAVRMLSVMSLVDGRADPEKTALVRSYAEALGVEDGYLSSSPRSRRAKCPRPPPA